MRSTAKIKYVITGFALSLVLFNCKTQKPLNGQKTKSFKLGKYSTVTMLGGYTLEFKENNEVTYKWNSDITSFDRHGRFEISNDTIEINYEPLLEITKLSSKENRSIIQFKNKAGKELTNCNIKIFKNEKTKEDTCDENGKIILEERIEKIDSIYLNWDFMEYGVYPKEHKFIPKTDKVEDQIIEGFVELEIILEEDLIGHPVSSNKYKLLIVGPNELYPGLDYDPNTIYVIGGTLKKASK